ncbi:MAG TPA: phytoene/squalene synthase family protein [Terriglobales bacterium]
MNTQLVTAYAVCRGIARTRAKNFYYGFLPLPKEKRNALCAVYAFMRHADDISDDASRSVPERSLALNTWLAEWHSVSGGTPTTDPVFFALADAQRRFKISNDLLDKLVAGTAMDLETADQEPEYSRSSQPSSTAVKTAAPYRTYNDLYQYCYYVASVVGLVCIRVYGYTDPRAEILAEKCGVAFQLTNIIRDVKEDAQMGRLYLPEEDILRFGLTSEDFFITGGTPLDVARVAPLLEFEAQRARELYQAADELMPLLDHDSRPAFWVMVTIYRRLLEKIAKQQYDVFRGRIRLSAPEKLAILSKGIIQSIFA